MFRTFITKAVFLCSGFFLLGLSFAHASTPSLSLSGAGDGNNVTVSVNGDANQSVLLFYTKTNSGAQIATLGNTSSSGYFSTMISTSGYGIAPESSVSVSIGGINGARSSSVLWPYSNTTTSTSNTFSLSQAGVILSVGQSTTATANNSGTNYLYLSNNSNAPIANINISGTQITVVANSKGSTVGTICTVGNATNCATINITVQDSNTASLSFSQNNITIASGQNVPISITGGTGYYMVQNNTNTAAVQTSMNGSIITISTTGTAGTASVTVCSTDMNACGIINVTVGSVSTTPLTFSQNDVQLSIGGTTSVSVSGGPTGSVYYISSNSNTGAVAVSMPTNSTTLTLTGISNGTSVVTVCTSMGSCGSLSVTVSYVSNGGPITLSQNTLSLLAGQTLPITIAGGTTPYNLLNPETNVVSSSINGNVLSITAISAGMSLVNVCSKGGACTGINITVTSSGSSIPGPAFSQNNISFTVGQSLTVSITGNGGYYISTNTSSTAVSAQISGSNLILYALGAGGSNITVCQNGGLCSILTVSVTSVTQPITTPIVETPVVVTPSVPVTPSYTFTKSLSFGANNSEVLELQKVLQKEGYLKVTPNGNFGPSTKTAVIAFQKANGLSPIGSVGPGTRAALNKLTVSSATPVSLQATTNSSLEQMLAGLKAQLAALQAQASAR